jgi:hypothetical protein
VTTELHIVGANYVDVYLSIGLQVREGFYQDAVREAVRRRLREYLSALPPGGPDERGWPLSRPLLRKELEAVAARVPGVDYVNRLYLGVGAAFDLDEYAGLTGLSLPRLAAIEVRIGEPELLEAILGVVVEPSAVILPVPVIGEFC